MKASTLTLALMLTIVANQAEASFINYSAHEVNVKVLFFGPLPTQPTQRNLAHLHARSKPSDTGKLITLAMSEDGAEYVQLFDLVIPELMVRGFKIRFHLYTAVAATPNAASWPLIIKGADGIVFVADAAPASTKRNLENLAALKQYLAALGIDYAKQLIVFQLTGTRSPNAIAVAELKHALEIGRRLTVLADPKTGVGVVETLDAITGLMHAELMDASAQKP